MKISLEWLKTFLPIRLPLEALTERLALGGLEVTSVEKKGNDVLLEIEVTPNRPDLLSHIGIAREIAALLGGRLKKPLGTQFLHPTRARQSTHLPLKIAIQDRKGCLRYIGGVFDQVKVGPSPQWMRERLERLGLRSVNNVVDITNYILLEEGQPLHAFDYDRIEGGEVRIRSAKAGETLLTIDGDMHTLQKEDLVIADSKKPIALAGVIGGKETEIGPKTQRVLLESAYFDPARVRRTSKRLGVSTESSYRFERGVSLEGVKDASEKTAFFFSKWANARLLRFLDLGKKSFPRKSISVSLQELHQILGASPSLSQTRVFLSRLGCRVSARKGSLRVIPPSFRRDLREAADLSEEIGRLLGYDQIPVTVPLRERTFLEEEAPVERERKAEERVKDVLVSQGLFEVVTYSLLSRALLECFFGRGAVAIPIRNPVSLEQELMRPSLVPRLVEVASFNHRRKAEGVPIFEVGPTYEKEGAQYREKRKLAILLSGKNPENWRTKSPSYDYFDLKGRCEALLKTLNASLEVTYHTAPTPFFSPEGPSMTCVVGGKAVGILGELASSITDTFDLKEKVVVAEMDLSELTKVTSFSKTYTPPPKFPSIRRDIALIADEKILSEELVKVIQEKGGEWVHTVSLFDTYSNPRAVPEGSRGLAYRIEFLHPDRTLTDEEVHERYQAILEALRRRGARIR